MHDHPCKVDSEAGGNQRIEHGEGRRYIDAEFPEILKIQERNCLQEGFYEGDDDILQLGFGFVCKRTFIGNCSK